VIVLDEQLLGRNLELEISRWYRGAVRFVIDLRPDTIVKDDAVPMLLRAQLQPTFVTINERDFWRKVPADERYCVVCFPVADSRASEIPERLRALLRRREFSTRARRMGKVIRVTDREISYYTVDGVTERMVT
jgi:hypothetical protein